jgi:hypothetical protein
MGGFNLSDYETVEERIKRFYADHPGAAIHTELASPETEMPKWVAFKALVKIDAKQDYYDATGYAMEVQGQGNVNRDAHVENCETSAIGRALANLNYSGSKRPSREEMSKVRQPEPTAAERTERSAKLDKMNPATEGDINKMLETFAKRGVTRADIEEYLGHTLKAGTDGAADMSVLRGIYSEMFAGKRADTWFPRWTGDVDVSGAAIAERVLGMSAKLDASLANIEPLVP